MELTPNSFTAMLYDGYFAVRQIGKYEIDRGVYQHILGIAAYKKPPREYSIVFADGLLSYKAPEKMPIPFQDYEQWELNNYFAVPVWDKSTLERVNLFAYEAHFIEENGVFKAPIFNVKLGELQHGKNGLEFTGGYTRRSTEAEVYFNGLIADKKKLREEKNNQ